MELSSGDGGRGRDPGAAWPSEMRGRLPMPSQRKGQGSRTSGSSAWRLPRGQWVRAAE